MRVVGVGTYSVRCWGTIWVVVTGTVSTCCSGTLTVVWTGTCRYIVTGTYCVSGDVTDDLPGRRGGLRAGRGRLAAGLTPGPRASLTHS